MKAFSLLALALVLAVGCTSSTPASVSASQAPSAKPTAAATSTAVATSTPVSVATSTPVQVAAPSGIAAEPTDGYNGGAIIVEVIDATRAKVTTTGTKGTAYEKATVLVRTDGATYFLPDGAKTIAETGAKPGDRVLITFKNATKDSRDGSYLATRFGKI